jgi:hypothetical protein
VKQLAVPRKGNAIHWAILTEYKARQGQGNLKHLLTADEILKLFSELVRPCSKVIIVLDGLDECKEESLEKLLDVFCTLLDSVDKLRIFASGRPDIKDALPLARVEVAIEVNRNETDIAEFVKSKINHARERPQPSRAGRLLKDEDLSASVSEAIIKKSNGM